MNDNPPPLDPNPAPIPHSYAQNEGSGKKVAAGCGIGCLVAVVVAVIAVIVAINFGKKKVGEIVSGYTADEAVEITQPDVPESEVEDAIARFDEFRTNISTGNPTKPLRLSEQDINALLFHHSMFEGMAGAASVSIENDRLSSTVSFDLDGIEIPIQFLADAVRGKYFNGEVTLTLDTLAGRPVMFIEELAVAGNPLPAEFMQGFRDENLLKEAQSDPELKKIFDKIKELKIENDQLVIVPANTPAGSQ